MKAKPVKADERLIAAVAKDSPPTDLDPYLTRLTAGGATKVEFFEEFEGRRDVICAEGLGGAQVWTHVEWEVCEAPIAAALNELAAAVQLYDRVQRLRLAARDMELAEAAAKKLLNRYKQGDVPTRPLERVLETGLVVTITRPYLDSNDAGVPARYRPSDKADRKLLAYLEDLRDNVHAHAGHTERRYIIDASEFFGMEGLKPLYGESYDQLSPDQLREIADLAKRHAKVLSKAAEQLDREFRAGSYDNSGGD